MKALMGPQKAYIFLATPEGNLKREGGLRERGLIRARGLFTKSKDKDEDMIAF